MLSVVGNVAADRNAALVRAVRAGDLDTTRAINDSLIPLVDAIMRTAGGAVMAKAALAELGLIPHATVRLPLVEPDPLQLRRLTDALYDGKGEVFVPYGRTDSVVAAGSSAAGVPALGDAELSR